MNDDLGLSSSQYEWLLSAFYVTYIGFEWMTLMYRVVPAHIYVSLCVFSWGFVASLQATAQSFPFLLVLRALLGMGEAAFSPGIPFYMSFFFRRNELAFRTGLLISAAPLAISFAGSLAWLITWLGSNGPIASWRLLFLIEGFPSIAVAALAWIWIPDSPRTARFLDPRQREVASLRLQYDAGGVKYSGEDTTHSEGDGSSSSSNLRFQDIIATLRDPKCYLSALMFFGCNVAFSSMPVFLPTVINEMGFSAITSQALAAPPFLISFFVVLVSARLSDTLQSRGFFICGFALLGSLSYAIIALGGAFNWPVGVRYAALCPAAAGFFTAVTLIITWTLNNQRSAGGRGTGLVILNIVGQCGPLLGTKLYPEQDGPAYVRGMTVCSIFMFLVFLLAYTLRWMLLKDNIKQRVLASCVIDDTRDDAKPLFPGLDIQGQKHVYQHVL